VRRPFTSRATRGLAGTLAAVSALLVGGCGSAAPVARPAVAVPPEVTARPGTGWPLPGHDYDNSRRALGSGITAATVHRLVPAWQVPTPGALTTAVVVVGDTVYAEDDQSEVVAVDRTTGAVRWRTPPGGFTVGPEGVAVGWGMVDAATPTGVEALDRRSGRLVWTRRLTTTPTAGVDAQPTVIGHRVLMATVPVTPAVQYQGGDQGELVAVDGRTGRIDWAFDTVDSPDVWGNPAVNSGGGAWYPPAVDPASGLAYWGTANPAPFPGTAQFPNGSSRPGRNLYSDSTVALDVRTGRLRWYHQAVAHDLFDQDFVHAMLIPVSRPNLHTVVVGTGKGGQVVGMDPASGRVLWTQSVGVHENHGLSALSGPTPVLPGTYGGVLTPPASAGGVAYLAVLNAPTVLSPDKTAYFGGKIGTMDGDVVAIDAATGSIRWTAHVPGDPTGGATVANDLVLTATFQGTLMALDRRTGAVVWTTDVGAGVSGWPAVVGNLLVVPTGTVGGPGRLVAYRLPAAVSRSKG
jgi:outer membrane protein assembly factor BamB